MGVGGHDRSIAEAATAREYPMGACATVGMAKRDRIEQAIDGLATGG